MKWRNLLHFVSNMSSKELDEEVTVYLPFYKREFKATVLTTLAAAKDNDFRSTDSPPVLVVDTNTAPNVR